MVMFSTRAQMILNMMFVLPGAETGRAVIYLVHNCPKTVQARTIVAIDP